MNKLTAWQMYNLLLDQKMIVAVMVNDEDGGATEITSRVERCGKYAFDDYELDRAIINPYSSADKMFVTMYLNEI